MFRGTGQGAVAGGRYKDGKAGGFVGETAEGRLRNEIALRAIEGSRNWPRLGCHGQPRRSGDGQSVSFWIFGSLHMQVPIRERGMIHRITALERSVARMARRGPQLAT